MQVGRPVGLVHGDLPDRGSGLAAGEDTDAADGLNRLVRRVDSRTPTICFQPFPFLAGRTPADTADQPTEATPVAALIPAHSAAGPNVTKRYNQRDVWLALAHETLDAAVAAVCGWTDSTPQMPDHKVLARLLALNLQRAGKG